MSLSDRSRDRATELRERIKQSLFTGLAITVPLLITLVVLSLVAGFVFGQLDPLVGVLEDIAGEENGTPRILLELLAIVLILFVIFLIGFAAESRQGDGHLEARFDRAMGNIPGVGTVYRTFDEMSEMVMDADTASFKEVKLVEFPTPNSYALGFVTAETPTRFEERIDDGEMLTLYVPMSPNPVMGGYVIYVPKDRCVDVDMSVEAGIKSIMTSGVSIGEGTTAEEVETVLPDAEDFPVDLPMTDEDDDSTTGDSQ
ncbi:DUF502 domain-containing protein [Halorhabdus sp. CUG00001]|uniref:DUF502 domain-containing protein n=1 Tax=Halorhabdus sp. CUG00001 TaxID=2600297 RepID=UPI001E410E1B|nr:DUF502 domain-containing protein [Halorhabdus sp. CUG00001]